MFCLKITDYIVTFNSCTCNNSSGVLKYPVRNDQTGEHGEAKNEDVSRRIHISILRM